MKAMYDSSNSAGYKAARKQKSIRYLTSGTRREKIIDKI